MARLSLRDTGESAILSLRHRRLTQSRLSMILDFLPTNRTSYSAKVSSGIQSANQRQRCKLSKCSLADVARRIISCFTTGMSDLGQKRTLRQVRAMSALPPKADKLTHRNYPQKSKGRPKTHQPFVSAASHVRTGKGVKSCSSTAATTITTT